MLLIFGLFTGYNKNNKKLTLSFMEMKGKGPGWGLAIIIQTPNGHTYLYDTGSNYPNAGFDAGKDAIAPFLKKIILTKLTESLSLILIAITSEGSSF